MNLPERKPNRLEKFDYSLAGYYFITICTADRKAILSRIVGAPSGRPQEIILTQYGKIVEEVIKDIPKHYKNTEIEKFVIMPNHIHMILKIAENGGRPMGAPTVSQIIRQTKGVIARKVGFSVFQRSFYDHIIRDENDYLQIWNYIDGNPLKWAEDEYYTNNNF